MFIILIIIKSGDGKVDYYNPPVMMNCSIVHMHKSNERGHLVVPPWIRHLVTTPDLSVASFHSLRRKAVHAFTRKKKSLSCEYTCYTLLHVL